MHATPQRQLGSALANKSHSRLHITDTGVATPEALPLRAADHCYGRTPAGVPVAAAPWRANPHRRRAAATDHLQFNRGHRHE